MKLFSTVKEYASAEQIIEKSRFITYVSPVENREGAEMFIADIKKKHKDATHNVPAMVLGDKMQIQWASDDGEPQGTSGAPIVQLLVGMGITNVCVVVTRYFGGVKLGTGGLVRAYTSSAKLGLEAAGICDVREAIMMTYSLDYSCLGKLQNLAMSSFFAIENTEFADKVIVDLSVDPERQTELEAIMSNLTLGKALPARVEKVLVKK